MEHHYSLTSRMMAIFVFGLVLIAVLVFAGGVLIGRDLGTREAIEQAKAAERSAANAVAKGKEAVTSGANTAAGAIRSVEKALTPPVLPKVPAIPKAP